MPTKFLDRKKGNPLKPVYTGIKHVENVKIQLFEYNEHQFVEDSQYDVRKFNGFEKDDSIYWLNVHGLHDVDIIKGICAQLNVHNLSVQDILDINQRPKLQVYEKHLFFTLKSILPNNEEGIEQEQLNFILGPNYVVSFQEKEADYFEHIRNNIRTNQGIVRQRGSDYLLYQMFESILDNYFKSVYKIETRVDEQTMVDMEDNSTPFSLRSIETLRRQVHQIKKVIIPMKDFVTKIERDDSLFIQEKHRKYFFELKDLCLTLIDDCDQLGVRLEGQTNLFFSVQGHRMNEVMKTLTMVATIFIPLTFVVGVYGMNFVYMPELNMRWGYFGVWFIMAILFVGMVIYFKRKRWF
ncbi:MAG: magnesium/cobalt transporter CorA [Salinivirgaceae bacterium]|nr:magnesium/cobalt transporter CorA [Salinivirgaceae bacterium]